jgi:hypothetical protein
MRKLWIENCVKRIQNTVDDWKYDISPGLQQVSNLRAGVLDGTTFLQHTREDVLSTLVYDCLKVSARPSAVFAKWRLQHPTSPNVVQKQLRVFILPIRVV